MSGLHLDSSENWDDEYEFQPTSDINARKKDPLLKDKKNTLPLQHWAEPGPSTPTKRVQSHAENWDDDFQDSPVRQQSRPSVDIRRSRARPPEPENWDEDFEEGRAGQQWDSSDEEELGFADKEEDRTVTSRRAPLHAGTPPPPVPPIPPSLMGLKANPEPFPRSPTASVFSVPTGGRDSVTGHSYSSTAHLALRPTMSGGSFAMLPPSPPIHRERRRLRKKSRPSHVDDNIIELEDRALSSPEPPLILPPQPVVDISDSTTNVNSKSPLLSRIGSVGKKWAVRKKRASTGPSEVMLPEDPHNGRPTWFFRSGGGGSMSGNTSPPAPATSLRHETSVDKLLSIVGMDRDPDSPSRRNKLKLMELPEISREASLIPSTPRRPTSMQIPSTAPGFYSRPSVPRHASHGRTTPSSRSSSKSRSASASHDDVNKVNFSEYPLPEKSTSRFMGGMRRISVGSGSKHKRTKSAAAEAVPDQQERPSNATTVKPFQVDDNSTPRAPVRTTRLSEDVLLPPIELQPPSPSRAPLPSTTSLAASSQHIQEGGLLLPHTLHEYASQEQHMSANGSPIDLTPACTTSKSKGVPSSPPQSASLGRTAQPLKDLEVGSSPLTRRNSLGDLKIPARISQAQVGLRRDLGMVREFAMSVEQLKQLQSTYSSLVAEIQTALNNSQPPPQSRAISPNLFNLPRPTTRARSNTNPVPSPQTHTQLASAFHSIESKYLMSWECAELLIELGGGAPAAVMPMSPGGPSSSQSAPLIQGSASPIDTRRSRERAVTLAGDESKPPVIPSVPWSPPMASPPNPAHWRASTGRNDLSQRQLLILREMLNNPDSSATMIMNSFIPEEEHINRGWRWGDAMSSTITLPSEESEQVSGSITSPHKKRRHSRLGMRGLRDMLKSLKKSVSEQQDTQLPHIPISATSVTISTDSSLNLPRDNRPYSMVQRRRAKTSTGPESMKSLRESHPNSPYITSASLTHRSSPRRPSLASIFRLGQKSKSPTTTVDHSSSSDLNIGPVHQASSSGSGVASSSAHTEEEEDWDRVDSMADLDQAARTFGLDMTPEGIATVRGRKGKSPYLRHPAQQRPGTPKRTPEGSHSSIWGETSPQPVAVSFAQSAASYSRSTKLSDVQELAETLRAGADTRRPPSRGTSRLKAAPSPGGRGPSSSRVQKATPPSGSVRSAPPQSWSGHGYSPELQSASLPDPKLAMTPENIKPLLENAREVQVRCGECISELRALLSSGRF